MSVEFCRDCGELKWNNKHKCPPIFLCWCPDYGEAEDGSVFRTPEALPVQCEDDEGRKHFIVLAEGKACEMKALHRRNKDVGLCD